MSKNKTKIAKVRNLPMEKANLTAIQLILMGMTEMMMRQNQFNKISEQMFIPYRVLQIKGKLKKEQNKKIPNPLPKSITNHSKPFNEDIQEENSKQIATPSSKKYSIQRFSVSVKKHRPIPKNDIQAIKQKTEKLIQRDKIVPPDFINEEQEIEFLGSNKIKEEKPEAKNSREMKGYCLFNFSKGQEKDEDLEVKREGPEQVHNQWRRKNSCGFRNSQWEVSKTKTKPQRKSLQSALKSIKAAQIRKAQGLCKEEKRGFQGRKKIKNVNYFDPCISTTKKQAIEEKQNKQFKESNIEMIQTQNPLLSIEAKTGYRLFEAVYDSWDIRRLQIMGNQVKKWNKKSSDCLHPSSYSPYKKIFQKNKTKMPKSTLEREQAQIDGWQEEVQERNLEDEGLNYQGYFTLS